MTPKTGGGYHKGVTASRSGAWRWIVVGALVCSAIFGHPAAVRAATTSFDVNDQVVVQVIGRSAAITIRTWSRNTVQVDWPDGESFEAARATQQTRSSFLIPTITVAEYTTPSGPVMATLLPEEFPVPNLSPGMHDVVRIKQNAGAEPAKSAPPGVLTVTIPVSTGLVNVRSGRGSIVLSDYHGTTIAAIGRGHIVLRGVSGDAFVQPLNGRFYAVDSDFDRLRIRSNRADQVFDSCRVKQIEATTLTGGILFDGGVFDAGLARFESDRGSIALGVAGGAQIGAHTQDGRIWTMLPPAQSPQPIFGAAGNTGDSDSTQFVGNGGPLVNATTVRGNVFVYDGSLGDRRPAGLGAPWRPMYNLLVATRDDTRPAAGPAKRR